MRALKPLASTVVVRHGGRETELTHEHDGVWVGVLPVAEVTDYRLAVAYDGAPIEVDDPYRFLPTLGEVDLHLINEGRHELLWTVLGARVRHYEGGASRHVVRRVGALGPRRAAQGRLQLLGRPRAPHAPARQLGGVGAVRPRRRHRHRLQVRRPGRRRRVAREGRPDGDLGRGAARDLVGGLRVDLRVGRPGVDGGAARQAGRQRGHERLRDAPRVVAARQDLGRAGRGAAGLPRGAQLHPRRADAGDAAPVRRVVGLPRDVVLRRGLAASATPTASGCWSTSCTRPGSA